MNADLDRQLARLRARLAKTPLPGFLAWWGRELMACLPARWREFLADRSESIVFGPEGGELVVWREREGRAEECGRIARDLEPERQAAEFLRLRGLVEDRRARNVYCLPAAGVLTRTLNLPAAAEANLRQVLAFEMDRQTPFKAEQVYFDARVLGHDPAARNVRVELMLIPRAQLDRDLEALPATARELDGVDSWQGTAGGARRLGNLLPPERRVRRRNLRTPLNIGLAVLALMLLAINMRQSVVNRVMAEAAMQAEVEQANAEAREVAALRKTLADSITGANFLAERKRNAPLTVALIDDISRRLPETAYLERLQIENAQVQLQGQATEAAGLIALLGASPCLGNPGFQGQVQPDPRTGKERFQITAELRECHPFEEGVRAAEEAPAAEDGDGH